VADSFVVLQSRFVVVPADDIDTDQIIPARFLTTTQRVGLGAHLFCDVRGPGGVAAVLDAPRSAGAEILVAGDNFGCGSSREHAPWALRDFGFRAVVSTSFADIFTSNALKNGLLPVVVPPSFLDGLRQSSDDELTIDLQACTVRMADGRAVSFAVEPFARLCLLQGMDPLDFLLEQDAAISAFERRQP